ncbi:MAG: porin family protein [Flavitalea sp.]
MKKLFFVPLIVLSTGLFAQQFQLGIKGGVNLSNLTGSSPNNVDKKALVGYHAGVILPLWFGESFAIQPEVLFSTQGARFKSATDGNNDFKVSYVTIPVLAKIRFGGGFYIEAGPQISFHAGDNIDESNVTVKSTDLAIDGGLGFHGKSGFGIGARYIAGLSKVADYEPGVTAPNYKNGVAQLFVFFTIFNGKK